VSAAVLAATVGVVAWQLHPSLLVSDTTTAGGDMGAHVALPAYLRSHLLAHGRITGWSPEWYDGYPAFVFYFPLPSLAIALASFLIPYNVAFKLVTVVGLLGLPVAAWALGRLSRAPRPAPECLAAATLPFLFDRTFTIDGGNIASTLAGEFGFSISLAIALVLVGVVASGLETGRRRALAGALFALCLLCHLLPALFAAAACAVTWALRPSRTRAWWVASALGAGLALTGFWTLPFVWRQRYATDMDYQKVTDYLHTLFPSPQRWVLVAAAVGLAGSVLRRQRLGALLGTMAAASALAVRLWPQGKLLNTRWLPFWVLCLYLLAGLGAAEAGRAAAWAWRRLERWRAGAGREPARVAARALWPAATALAATAASLAFVVAPLVTMPSWLSWLKVQPSFIPDWVRWNYSGYEAKAAWPEYRSLIDTMAAVGRRYGCGRAMWEYEPEENQLGTPEALMILPYWTHSCIDSMEGLLYESSATTPFHFLNQAELSSSPSEAMGGLDYGPLDVAAGVAHLQLLGVRYYMAVSPAAQAQADQQPALRLVATSGPWPVSEAGRTVQQTWKVYLVSGSAEVAPLSEQPVVLKGGDADARAWLQAALWWYGEPSVQDVALAASGPPSWARVGARDPSPPRRPVTPARVRDISATDHTISFDVDRTGSPVLVKASYFPNWQATGAEGPWRVAPNLMVVVPTSRHVELHYGWTPVDAVGWLASLGGLVGLVAMARRPALVMSSSARRRRGRLGVPEVGFARPMPLPLDQVFKAYDIRGTVPHQMSPELCRAVGAAFAAFSRAGRLLVGRDMRASSPAFARAFVEGASSQGADVVDIGLASTDLVYFASGRLGLPAAMFTASHNPPDYNGIKLCLAGARPVGEETGLGEIKALAASYASGGLAPARRPGKVEQADMLGEFADHVRSFVDTASLRPLRVVADTANGMGGLVVPAVFDGLPFSLELLYGELDGTFPNHPADPIQEENLADLKARVLATGADVGLAFDGDADRVFLVDDAAQPLSGSLTTAMVAKAMLAKHPGSTILYNLICSKAVPEVIAENGGTPVRTRVGHSFIKAKMAETDAVFGGEHSGHYYFRDNYRADSGLIAALVVLELLSREARPLSELRKPFERYAGSGEINTEVQDPAAVIAAVEQRFGSEPGAVVDHLDGLSVDLGSWWFNLRPSNTEPLLRLNLEAQSEVECRRRVGQVMAVIAMATGTAADRAQGAPGPG
jgi:phosphomannomutase